MCESLSTIFGSSSIRNNCNKSRFFDGNAIQRHPSRFVTTATVCKFSIPAVSMHIKSDLLLSFVKLSAFENITVTLVL